MPLHELPQHSRVLSDHDVRAISGRSIAICRGVRHPFLLQEAAGTNNFLAAHHVLTISRANASHNIMVVGFVVLVFQVLKASNKATRLYLIK